jgi:hypothetical protein
MALAVRALLWGIAGPLAAARAGTATFDELVALAAAAVAIGVLGWVGVVLAVTTLAALPGEIGGTANRLAGRIAPGLAGRLARIALGLTLTAGPLSACTPALGGAEGRQHEVVAAGAVGDSGLPGVGRIGEVITPNEVDTSGEAPAAGTTDAGHVAAEPLGGASPASQAPVSDPGSAAELPDGEPTATPAGPPPTAGLAEVATASSVRTVRWSSCAATRCGRSPPVISAQTPRRPTSPPSGPAGTP